MSTQLAAYERQDLELEKISIGLENIISILAVIKQSPVIDKSMAKDLENEYPGIITTKASLESFSDTLSTKGHSIALESIKDRLRTMRDAIVKAFKNAVKKFKEWLDSIFRKSKDTSKEAKQKNDESAQAHAAATALIEKHSDGIAVALNAKSNGVHLTAHDIADVINNAAAEILAKHTSKLILFMLKENAKIGQDEVKYLQHFDKDAQRLPALFTDIAHKIDTLVSDINSGKITNESDLSIYTVDIISFLELDDANASDKSENVIKSAEQAATLIKQALNEMVAAPAFPDVTAEDLRGRNSELSLLWEKLSLINLQIDHYEHMSRVIQPIDKIENSLTHLEASVGKIQNAEGNSRGIATAVDNLRGCFKVAHLFLMSSKIAYDESIRFSKVLHKASFMQVKHLVEALATLPEGDKIISEMKKLAIVHSTGASLEDEDDAYDDLSHEVPDEDYDAVAAAFTEFDTEEDDEDHLTISNESIGGKIKEGIKAAYEKVKSLIERFFNWVKEFFTKANPKDTAVRAKKTKDEADQTEEDINNAAKDVDANTDNIDRLTAQQVEKIKAHLETIGHAKDKNFFNRFMSAIKYKNVAYFMADIKSHDPMDMSQLVMSCRKGLETIDGEIAALIDSFRKAVTAGEDPSKLRDMYNYNTLDDSTPIIIAREKISKSVRVTKHILANHFDIEGAKPDVRLSDLGNRELSAKIALINFNELYGKGVEFQNKTATDNLQKQAAANKLFKNSIKEVIDDTTEYIQTVADTASKAMDLVTNVPSIDIKYSDMDEKYGPAALALIASLGKIIAQRHNLAQIMPAAIQFNARLHKGCRLLLAVEKKRRAVYLELKELVRLANTDVSKFDENKRKALSNMLKDLEENKHGLTQDDAGSSATISTEDNAAAFTDFVYDEDHLTISNESIGGKIKEGIKAAYAKLKEMLKKLIDWVKSFFSKNDPASTTKAAEETEENAKEAEKQKSDLEKDINKESAKLEPLTKEQVEKIRAHLDSTGFDNDKNFFKRFMEAIKYKEVANFLADPKKEGSVSFPGIVRTGVESLRAIDLEIESLADSVRKALNDKMSATEFSTLFTFDEKNEQSVTTTARVQMIKAIENTAAMIEESGRVKKDISVEQSLGELVAREQKAEIVIKSFIESISLEGTYSKVSTGQSHLDLQENLLKAATSNAMFKGSLSHTIEMATICIRGANEQLSRGLKIIEKSVDIEFGASSASEEYHRTLGSINSVMRGLIQKRVLISNLLMSVTRFVKQLSRGTRLLYNIEKKRVDKYAELKQLIEAANKYGSGVSNGTRKSLARMLTQLEEDKPGLVE